MNKLFVPSGDDIRWDAVRRRDGAADGQFFYSVRTTGVYCRPSCGARLPRRENVRFHETAAEAEKAGFRACKRCRPNAAPAAERKAETIAKACRLIEAAVEAPTLATLAAAAGMSNFHFHRQFREITGLTPKAYANAVRDARARASLAAKTSVTEALYDAGFNSSGSFYAASSKMLGMTPTAFRAGAPDANIRFAIGKSSLGDVLVAATDIGICAIFIGDDADELLRDLQRRFPRAKLIGGDKKFEKWVAKVVGFVEAPRLGLDLPLDVRGTAFQRRVWQALTEIPPGSTATYTEIAEKIGAPKSVRAVAGACAANHIAVAIPCHRVVRKGGDLSGYYWGVERKDALLKREAK